MNRAAPRSLITQLCLAAAIGAALNVGVAIGCCLLRPGLTNDYGDPTAADLRIWIESVPKDFPPEPSGTTPNWLGVGFHTSQMLSEPADNPNRKLFILYVVRAGWPFHALQGVMVQDGTHAAEYRSQVSRDALGTKLDIPIGPIPGGFLANTALYGGAAFIAGSLLRAAHRRHRLSRGACLRCGHPLGIAKVCTECGASGRASAGPA